MNKISSYRRDCSKQLPKSIVGHTPKLRLFCTNEDCIRPLLICISGFLIRLRCSARKHGERRVTYDSYSGNGFPGIQYLWDYAVKYTTGQETCVGYTPEMGGGSPTKRRHGYFLDLGKNMRMHVCVVGVI